MPQGVGLDRDRARVLLIHAPDYLGAAEAAGAHFSGPGIRIWGSSYLGVRWRGGCNRQFVYGLSRIGNMQIPYFERSGNVGTAVMLEFQ